MKRFIIEGCDGVGKSTLAKKIAEAYGIDYVHVGTEDPSDWKFYFETLRKANVIFDRHFIGERVYPKFFGRRQLVGKYRFKQLLQHARELGYIVIILTANDEVLTAHNENDTFEAVRNNYKKINKKFVKIAQEYDIPLLNVFEMTETELMNTIGNLVNEQGK
jgi:thymidylate kinase